MQFTSKVHLLFAFRPIHTVKCSVMLVFQACSYHENCDAMTGTRGNHNAICMGEWVPVLLPPVYAIAAQFMLKSQNIFPSVLCHF